MPTRSSDARKEKLARRSRIFYTSLECITRVHVHAGLFKLFIMSTIVVPLHIAASVHTMQHVVPRLASPDSGLLSTAILCQLGY